MVKMKERNGQLKSSLGAMAPKERILAANSIPKEDTVNRQGHAAYSLDDELRLIAMLNTLKLEPQYYRSENETMRELRDLIERIALRDPYFVAQAIVYSRCVGEGMRSINHLAAALLAPFIAGEEYAKRFYGLWNKKEQRGGCIFRVDDMSEIKDVYSALNKSTLSNSMKKGFAKVLESLDTYQMAKYKGTVIDIANLVHPKSVLSTAMITTSNGEQMRTLDALMKGVPVSADTWEVAQSEAGQEVAKAVREGKLSKAEAAEVLAEAKADNWESLLKDGKLGILAALRNIRNIMITPRKETIDAWCKLITDGEKVRKALILPVHFDLAYDIVDSEFNQHIYANQVRQALQDGYTAAIPNLANVLTGKTLVVVDRSGSMDSPVAHPGDKSRSIRYSDTQKACYKAGLIAATICHATHADVVKFGSNAEYFSYDKNMNVFALAKRIGTASWDSTNPAAAFELIRRMRKAYDRIIFISDNEVNGQLTSAAYKAYVHDVADPYVYGVDLCAYGTTPLKRDGKVQYFFGYGPSLFESIASSEFNPAEHLEKVRKIVI